MSFSRRAVLIAAGILSVALAAAGIVLPLLPTTPFLLLAAACFLRSSDRLYRWLITHRWFGSYIQNYREHGGVTRQAKSGTIILLWGTLGYSAVGIADSAWLRLLLVLVGIGVTAHVLRLKTMEPDRRSKNSSRAGKGCGEIEGSP